MDNASYYYSAHLQPLYDAAGVRIIKLPPKTPIFNPIEEFFSKLKALIRKKWQIARDLPDEDVITLLKWCINIAGADVSSVEGFFRHVGFLIENN